MACQVAQEQPGDAAGPQPRLLHPRDQTIKVREVTKDDIDCNVIVDAQPAQVGLRRRRIDTEKHRNARKPGKRSRR